MLENYILFCGYPEILILTITDSIGKVFIQFVIIIERYNLGRFKATLKKGYILGLENVS